MTASALPTNGKTIFWLVGLLLPPLVGIVIGWVTTTNIRLSTHGEHLAVMQSQVADTREELKRINRKLDQLLEHRRIPDDR